MQYDNEYTPNIWSDQYGNGMLVTFFFESFNNVSSVNKLGPEICDSFSKEAIQTKYNSVPCHIL